jgi:hypothetical protein
MQVFACKRCCLIKTAYIIYQFLLQDQWNNKKVLKTPKMEKKSFQWYGSGTSHERATYSR